MHRHCGTNNRAPLWTSTDPCNTSATGISVAQFVPFGIPTIGLLIDPVFKWHCLLNLSEVQRFVSDSQLKHHLTRDNSLFVSFFVSCQLWVLGRERPYFVKEHSDSKRKYTEEDIINMFEFLVDNIFVVFTGKFIHLSRSLFVYYIPTDNRHSHGHKLCPSPSQHSSVFIWSGIHTVLALGRKETVSISGQLHI